MKRFSEKVSLVRSMNGRRAGFIALLVSTVVALGLVGVGIVVLTTRESMEDGDQRIAAIRAAQHGVEHYRGQFALDESCFDSAPRVFQPCRDGSFRLESAELRRGQWTIVVVGRHGDSTHRTVATIGAPVVEIPTGIVIASSTHKSTDETFRLEQSSLVASFDSRRGPFGADNAGTDARVSINGSLTVAFMSSVFGDVSATGGLVTGDPLSIAGSLTENGPEAKAQDIDPVVRGLIESSRASNDNAVLSSVFGSQWTPKSPVEESYGDLIVEQGSHIIPSGVYRFRRFEVQGGATVTFDTTRGPSTVVYVGAGPGTGPRNHLSVDGGSSVLVNPGPTANGLLIVLGDDTGLEVRDRSVFGRAAGAESNAGCSRIIGAGSGGPASELVAANGSSVYASAHATGHRLTVEGRSGWHGSAAIRSLSISESFFAVDVRG